MTREYTEYHPDISDVSVHAVPGIRVHVEKSESKTARITLRKSGDLSHSLPAIYDSDEKIKEILTAAITIYEDMYQPPQTPHAESVSYELE